MNTLNTDQTPWEKASIHIDWLAYQQGVALKGVESTIHDACLAHASAVARERDALLKRPCPHVITSPDGTSYCTLAQSNAVDGYRLAEDWQRNAERLMAERDAALAKVERMRDAAEPLSDLLDDAEQIYSEATEHTCTCGTDSADCKFCCRWAQADRILHQVRKTLRSLDDREALAAFRAAHPPSS